MDDFYTDEEGDIDEFGDDVDLVPTDPFDGLTKRDQDTFFRMLDLVPDEHRENAIIYFMDHPAKIRAVIAGVKERKEMLENKDVEALNVLFEQEHVQFENAMADFAETV